MAAMDIKHNGHISSGSDSVIFDIVNLMAARRNIVLRN